MPQKGCEEGEVDLHLVRYFLQLAVSASADERARIKELPWSYHGSTSNGTSLGIRISKPL